MHWLYIVQRLQRITRHFTKKLNSPTRPLLTPCAHLYVAAACDLAEVLVQLQGLVHLVVGHAVAAQAPLARLVHLGEHHELGHVGHRHQLAVQQVGEGHRLGRARAVGQPEPGGGQPEGGEGSVKGRAMDHRAERFDCGKSDGSPDGD